MASTQLIPLQILLADDDTDDCIFFEEALKDLQQTSELVTVNDGEQLMHHLNDKSNELPDVLFLDLNMPRKNGFECLAEIKASERLNKLPVIIFSTSLEQEVVNQLYKNGAHYFIHKPAEFPKFKKIIQQTLNLITQKNITQPSRENFVFTVQNEILV
jgi:CheY-like chemotaxis protein